MWPLIALLIAGIGAICGWMFLPVIQVSTNASNVALNAALTNAGQADAPIAAIVHSAPVWMFPFITVLVLLIYVKVAGRT